MRLYILAAASLLVLAACQKAAEPPPVATPSQAASAAPTPAPPASPAEPLDPFVVSIDAQRWGVLLDKAIEGIREAPAAPGAIEDTDLYRADRSLKSSAADLLRLRNDACYKGLATGDDCNFKDWPAWTLEPPSPDTPIEEIDRRSQWLSGQMSKLTDLGCEAGRTYTKDDMYCSVE